MYICKYFYHTNQRYTSKMMNMSNMIKMIKMSIPPLDNSSHKGQAGRIGIVGGSLEYTGAPYFAGISALKVGADLVHIFCPSSAATVIKSFSPDLIVHPLLDRKNAVNEISPWLDRLHVIVIGPGLGRDTITFKVISELIETIKNMKIPLIIDADGLFLVTESPHLLNNFTSSVILTPNKIEFERLQVKLNEKTLGDKVTVLKKGALDEFISSNAEVQWKADSGGSGRRCGGQGDLLSGSIATFLHWTISNVHKIETDQIEADKLLISTSLACYAGSLLIRMCNKKAFEHNGRSMLANDMIQYIHESFEELFDQRIDV